MKNSWIIKDHPQFDLHDGMRYFTIGLNIAPTYTCCSINKYNTSEDFKQEVIKQAKQEIISKLINDLFGDEDWYQES